jgi:hypothetical protein
MGRRMNDSLKSMTVIYRHVAMVIFQPSCHHPYPLSCHRIIHHANAVMPAVRHFVSRTKYQGLLVPSYRRGAAFLNLRVSNEDEGGILF